MDFQHFNPADYEKQLPYHDFRVLKDFEYLGDEEISFAEFEINLKLTCATVEFQRFYDGYFHVAVHVFAENPCELFIAFDTVYDYIHDSGLRGKINAIKLNEIVDNIVG